MSDRLTVERLFSDPPLNTPLPGRVRFSPDGQRITFTRLSADDRDRQDLWSVCCDTGEQTLLIDARTLDIGAVSDADRERLERQRQFVGGITDYAWFPSGDALLLPLGGRSYRYDLSANHLTELAPEHDGKGDVRLSPEGRYLTYVISNDLFVTDLADNQTHRLTHDGSEAISNGLADFIAQEEMHRFEGYWWSSDERALVFAKVDSTPIPVTHRQEINADGVVSVAQRYPYAGGPNATVSLFRFDAATREIIPIELPEQAEYLARVNFVRNTLTVQLQDRPQQHLALYGLEESGWRLWQEERSTTWVNLHDNLTAVGDANIAWTSEADGQARLLVGEPGALRPLTPATMHVVQVLEADADSIWFNGWEATPVEQHLFHADVASGAVTRLTSAAGWHTCVVHRQSRRFVDASSNASSPPAMSLHDLTDGQQLTELHSTALDDAHPYTRFLERHSAPEFGTVTAEDGATLHYRLTPPIDLKPGQRAPTIVYVYGGPGAQKVRNEWGALLLQLFAHAGFGVFELDNRGSAHRGRTFEAPLYKAMGTPEVADQVRGVEALVQTDWVDPERIGVFGHSYGGFMTLMCLCKASSVFRAGASVAPVSDWRLYDTHYTERYMGDPDRDKAAYDNAAVIPWLAQLERPLLLMHGMADDNVLFTHTTLLMRELQKLNRKFELMTYPGSKHALQERDVSIHRFEMILDFFRRTL